jgi:hypothetical protein
MELLEGIEEGCGGAVSEAGQCAEEVVEEEEGERSIRRAGRDILYKSMVDSGRRELGLRKEYCM